MRLSPRTALAILKRTFPQRNHPTVGDSMQQLANSTAGFAVRADWPDGTHEVMLFGHRLRSVEKRMKRAANLWRRSPQRPTAWTVIAVDTMSYNAHDRACRYGNCAIAGLSIPGGGR